MFNKNLTYLLLFVVIFTSSLAGVLWYANNREPVANPTNNATNTAQTNPITDKNPDNNNRFLDLAGEDTTKKLKEAGYQMGFISSKSLAERSIAVPVSEPYQTTVDKALYKDFVPLESLFPAPQKAEKTSTLVYPKLKIEAPLIYASFEDIFTKNSKGEINFFNVIQESKADIDKGKFTSVPYQQLLTKGVLHVPFSPAPGEIGSSYIVGHSSNYITVKSKYNEIFKDLKDKSATDDTFFIYDAKGRKLTFKVFESKVVEEADVGEAYKSFPNRRVVTLQSSVLENIKGKLVPTKRFLLRAELVLESKP
jgi:hypothetical protein